MAEKIVILGSTGSIGENTLRVLEDMKDRYEIYGLLARENNEALLKQAERLHVKRLGLINEDKAKELRKVWNGELFTGRSALTEICEGADAVVLAVVGVDGLLPFEYCLKHGIRVLFATKEAMVYGGRLLRDLIDSTGTEVLPLDSEISAIFQAIRGNEENEIKEIYLTASGGPFIDRTLEEIKKATLEEALRHPNWSMGRKITIDSATMANKGLEIMETRWMFDVDPQKITPVIHRESIVHSAVKFMDNSVMAQMGETDMKLPIAYALNYPDRKGNCSEELDIFSRGSLHFERPDLKRFPCLRLAMEAVRKGIPDQIVFNAANDAAVELFQQRRISFWNIGEIIEASLERHRIEKVESFEDIFLADREIRALVSEVTKSFTR